MSVGEDGGGEALELGRSSPLGRGHISGETDQFLQPERFLLPPPQRGSITSQLPIDCAVDEPCTRHAVNVEKSNRKGTPWSWGNTYNNIQQHEVPKYTARRGVCKT